MRLQGDHMYGNEHLAANKSGGAAIPFVVFCVLAGFLFWAHHPVGTYELSGDLWKTGNFVAGKLNPSHFSKDYFMSNKDLYEHYLMMTNIFGYKVFGDWEAYIAVLNPLLFLIGSVLLYAVLVRLCRSHVVAFSVSLLYSAATVWFMSGDIFALIPIYGAVDKSISYVWYLGILVVLFSGPLSAVRVVSISIMVGVMVYIHPLTFMGPGIATFAVVVPYYLWVSEEGRGRRVFVGLVCCMTVLLVAMPYVYRYTKGARAGLSANLSSVEKAVIVEDFIADRGHSYNPMDMTYFKQDVRSIGGYQELLALAIVLFIVGFNSRNVKFLGAFAATCVLIAFAVRLIEYVYFRTDGITMFTPLVRNMKWIYFYSVLIIVAAFGELGKYVGESSVGKNILMVNALFVALVVVCLRGPLYRSTYHNYVGMTIAEKIGLCGGHNGERGIASISKFCTSEDTMSIVKINKDVQAVIEFMVSLPSDLTFAGPGWLRYKAHRSLVHNDEDGIHYILSRDREYIAWKKRQTIYRSMVEDWICNGMWKEKRSEMGKLKADLVLIEKFSHIFNQRERRLVFMKKGCSLGEGAAMYENDSFAIVDLRRGVAL